MIKGSFIPGTFILAAFAVAFAHLEPGSLSSPKGGSSYAAGSKVNITWIQAEYHRGNYSLGYSKNGGTTWESIASWTGPSGDNVTVNYSWTVPSAASTTSKVRVCQLGNCNEADYLLVSPNFTITAGTGIQSPIADKAAAMRFLPDSRHLDVTFSLDRGENVSLQVFDFSGRLLATLLDGEHAAGSHQYTLGSRSLADAGKGGQAALIFKLTIGNRTFSESWSALP